MKILFANVAQEIGQVSEAEADAEVKRMNEQTNTNDWHKDYSDWIYSPDETDEDVYNPCERNIGYCFVTSSNNVKTFN